MATYRVRDGYTLAHGGRTWPAGSVVELSREVAADIAVRGHLEEVDASGTPVAPVPLDEFARFRTHERIGKLHEQLAQAEARVGELKTRIQAEEQVLEQEVAAAAAQRDAAPQTERAGSPPAAQPTSPTTSPKKE